MNTLFDDSKYIVKPRSTDGTFCTTRNFKTIQRLRMCITGEVRRRDCFSKQLRQRDEEIIKLKNECKTEYEKGYNQGLKDYQNAFIKLFKGENIPSPATICMHSYRHEFCRSARSRSPGCGTLPLQSLPL